LPNLIARDGGVTSVGAEEDGTLTWSAEAHDVLDPGRAGTGPLIGGHAVADGALLLELSQMCSVHVDPSAKVARVGGASCLMTPRNTKPAVFT